MNYSRVLSVLLVCFVCSSLTSSKQSLTDDIQRLNQQLQKTSLKFKRGYLYLTLAAASSGHNFVKVPEAITKDCMKTAKAIMTLFSSPSTYNTTSSIINSSVDKTIEHLKSDINQSLIKILCNILNEEAPKNQSNNFNFQAEKNKTWAALPRQPEDYFIAIPQKQTVDQYMKSGTMTFVAFAKEIIKFCTIRAFRSCEDEKSNVKHRECMASATAISQLSQHENRTIREHVDQMFKDAFEKYFRKEVYNDMVQDYYRTNSDYAANFAKILNNYIVAANKTYSVEKEMYERIINETIGEPIIAATKSSRYEDEL